MESLQERVRAAGYELPQPVHPRGRYEPFVWSGSQVRVAGQLPRRGEDVQYAGVVGGDVAVSDARAAAALCALNTLAVVAGALDADGAVNNLRLVNLNGFVRCTSDFVEQAKVVDGASQLFLDVLGERGKHVRTAVGVPPLPRGVPVEISTVWEVSGRGR